MRLCYDTTHEGRGALLRLNVFRGARDKVPHAQADLEWPELCDELEALTAIEAADKLALPAFTLGTLSEPYNVNANYLNHTALAIDVDNCPPVVLEQLEALELAAFVYASPSDPNPDQSRRVRIVVPLSRPLPVEHVKHVRRAFAESIGIGPGQGVETADAVSQLMFVGRITGTPERECWRLEGSTLDTHEMIARPLALKWKKETKHTAKPNASRAGIVDPDERTIALLDVMLLYWEAPGEASPARREVLRALGSYLAKRGWVDEQIAALVRGLPTSRPEALRMSEAMQGAADARANPSGTIGWTRLLEWDPEAAEMIESVAKDPREPDGFVGVWSERWAKIEERAAERERQAREAYAPAAKDHTPDYDWTTPDEPIDWYCKALGIAPSERKVTLIAGDPGSGKGPLSQHLAVCFAFGLKAFGSFECKQCNVGILDYEGARLSARRIKSHALGLGRKSLDLQNRIFLRDCEPGDLGFLEAWLEEHSIKVLIVDSYMSAMASTDADPNSPEYAQLARDLGTLGIVVIVIAHARKPAAGKRGDRPALGDVAGSYALGGMAATAIAVWNPDDDDRQLARIGCMRAPDEAFKTFDVRWTKSGTEEKPIWSGNVEGLATRDARDAANKQSAEQVRDEKLTRVVDHVVACLMQHAGVPRSVNALSKDTGIHNRDVGAAVAALARARLVHPQATVNGASSFVLVGDHKGGLRVEAGEIVPGPERRRFGGKFSV